ncbi:Flagellar M-ring protein [bacterium HR40]|nr:Flagellar M-ring protein [bacterium HR40]
MAQELQAGSAENVPVVARSGLPALLEQLRGLGPGRILALGAVLLAMLGFAGFALQRALEPRYALLFAGLESREVAAITDKLDATGVPWRLNARGDAVLVPADRVASVRMALAEEGLPAGDVVGYELFDRGAGFATTDFQANVNLKRALEGELARTISSLEGVRAARVHLVQPVRRLFEKQTETPSASVFLSLGAGAKLGRRQVEGIRHLVASAVPGLEPGRVTVMDDRGELLARGEADAEGFVLEEADSYRRAFEENLRDKLVRALERTVGAGRVDAQVTAELDFDERTSTEEVFDPQSQVARSTRTTEETSERSETGTSQAVTVTNNLPGAQQPPAAAPTSNEQTNRTEEVTNYELSRTVRSQRRRAPEIRRLFVAVQVDGIEVQAADGSRRVEPRSAEELAQLEAIARGIAGIDEERGDRLELVSRPFVMNGLPELPEPSLIETVIGHYGHLLESALWLAAAGLVLAFGLRPLLRRLLPSGRTPIVQSGQTAVVLAEDGRPLLVHARSGTVVSVDEAGRPVIEAREEAKPAVPAEQAPAEMPAPKGELVDLKNVLGKVKASLVDELADIFEKHPEEAVRVIRGWLHG